MKPREYGAILPIAIGTFFQLFIPSLRTYSLPLWQTHFYGHSR